MKVLLLLLLGPVFCVSQDINSLILKGFNTVRDTVINPVIHKAVPDPLSINTGKSGRADAGCIIPSPFGCICHAHADYSVLLSQMTGVNAVTITDFTSCNATATTDPLVLAISLTASVALSNAAGTGSCHASCSACGISPSASGSVSTEADTVGTILITGSGQIDQTKNCVLLSVDQSQVSLASLNLHDTHVKIDVGPIPGIDIGALAKLVLELVPSITDDIKGAIQDPISDAIHDAVNGAIPCISLNTTKFSTAKQTAE